MQGFNPSNHPPYDPYNQPRYESDDVYVGSSNLHGFGNEPGIQRYTHSNPSSYIPPMPQHIGPMPRPQKSHLAAGLIAIFLGEFGIHNFYLGRTGLGFIQLLLTVLTLGLLYPVVKIWTFIEGILYLVGGGTHWSTDAQGYPLR